MCKRNGTYGIPRFTFTRFLLIKQCITFAVSLLNWKRTNCLFGGLFYHTQQFSEFCAVSERDSWSTSHRTIHHPGRAAIPSRNQGFAAGSAPPPAKPGLKLTPRWVLSGVSMTGARTGQTALLDGASSLGATLKTPDLQQPERNQMAICY